MKRKNLIVIGLIFIILCIIAGCGIPDYSNAETFNVIGEIKYIKRYTNEAVLTVKENNGNVISLLDIGKHFTDGLVVGENASFKVAVTYKGNQIIGNSFIG